MRFGSAATIVFAFWLLGSIALAILFGPGLVVVMGGRPVNLAGAIALAAGISIAVWNDRRTGGRRVPKAPVPVGFASQPSQPAGTTPAGPLPAVGSPIEGTKVCPDCAETVLAAARICRFCRYEFRPAATT